MKKSKKTFELKYYFADKVHTCAKGKAKRAPSVV